MSTITVSTAASPDNWSSWNFVLRLCAEQLRERRLALVVGAGVSQGFKLPNWEILTERICAACTAAVPPGDLTLEEKAEYIWANHCNRDDREFALLVRDALYAEYSFDLATLTSNSLLAAIGALVLPSRLGAVHQVVSFNFDEVLETYLGHLGFLVDTIVDVPCWATQGDVAIAHPHGLLPRSGPPRGKLVFTSASFGRVTGDITSAWHRELLAVMSSHFCLFVGLSGKDENLMSLAQRVQPQHASKENGFAYWGVRLAKPDDSRRHKWEERGIAQVPVSYSEIPDRLFSIRQAAGRL